MKRLILAHKILIATAVIFFFFLSAWEYRHYMRTEDAAAVLRAILYLLVGLGFAIYFANIRRWYK
jgi:hypothetical protein